MARPTKYSPKFTDELLKYFSDKPYKLMGQGAQRRPVASDFPSLAGFASKIGVHRETLLEWSKEHPEFSDAYKRAADLQENWLIINGLKGLVSSNFGTFIAKAVCGMRDKQPGEDSINIQITLADRLAKARARVNGGKK